MNKLMTNMVDFLKQQNDRIKRAEENQEKITTEIVTQIEAAIWNQRHETPTVVDDVVSIPLEKLLMIQTDEEVATPLTVASM